MKQKEDRTEERAFRDASFDLVSCTSEDWLLTPTFRDLPDRKDLIAAKTFPEIP